MTGEFCNPEIYSVGLLLSLVNQSIMSYLGKRDQVGMISFGLRIYLGVSDPGHPWRGRKFAPLVLNRTLTTTSVTLLLGVLAPPAPVMDPLHPPSPPLPVKSE